MQQVPTRRELEHEAEAGARLQSGVAVRDERKEGGRRGRVTSLRPQPLQNPALCLQPLQLERYVPLRPSDLQHALHIHVRFAKNLHGI